MRIHEGVGSLEISLTSILGRYRFACGDVGRVVCYFVGVQRFGLDWHVLHWEFGWRWHERLDRGRSRLWSLKHKSTLSRSSCGFICRLCGKVYSSATCSAGACSYHIWLVV